MKLCPFGTTAPLFIFIVISMSTLQTTNAAYLDQATTRAETEPSAPYTDVWNQFVYAKVTGNEEPTLPDFSYAGYEYGTQTPEDNMPTTVFNVNTCCGAVGDGITDDRKAIQDAINKAEQEPNGAIVEFNAGTYVVEKPSGHNNVDELLRVKKSNIVLRGQGSGSTIIKMVADNSYLQTSGRAYPLIMIRPGSYSIGDKNPDITMTGGNSRGKFTITVSDAQNKLAVGDYIILRLADPDAAARIIHPYDIEPAWARLDPNSGFTSTKWDLHGHLAEERHEITAISGDVITLREPLQMDVNSTYNWVVREFDNIKNVGIEGINFVGGWQGNPDHGNNMCHHRTEYDDNGFQFMNIELLAHSWLKDLKLTNWTYGIRSAGTLGVTFEDLTFDGFSGHHSIVLTAGTYGSLISGYKDTSMYKTYYQSSCKVKDRSTVTNGYNEKTLKGFLHGPTIDDRAAGNVITGAEWPENSGIDPHGKYPYATLFDKVSGGLNQAVNSGGGAQQNLPNHMRHLVLWNFEEVGTPAKSNWIWWRNISEVDLYPNNKYYRVLFPIIVGFHGKVNGQQTPFSTSDTELVESQGTPVTPESLFDAQRELRFHATTKTVSVENGVCTGTTLANSSLRIGPRHGDIEFYGATGDFTYRPSTGYVGKDFFQVASETAAENVLINVS